MGRSICVILWLSVAVACLALSDKDRQALDDLFKEYNTDKAPGEPGATLVQTGIYISTMWIDDKNNEMKMRLILRELWDDERLKFTAEADKKFVVMPKDLETKIWVPDLYFRRALNLERYVEPHDQRLVRLYTNGTVWRATAYTVSFLCTMNFNKYPSDTQACNIEIESFSNTADHTNITFLQRGKPLALGDEYHPVNGDWILNDYITYDCHQYYITGTYPCVGFKLTFTRDSVRFDQETHAPLALLLVVAYVSYFISRKNAFLRFGYVFLIGIMLISATLNAHMTLSHPNARSIMTADIWECVCFFLYFCVVLHTVVVLSLESKGKKNNEPGPFAARARQVDRIGMVGYPIAYFVWIILYFAIL